MDIITGLLLSTNWKSNSYDPILAIVDCLRMIVYYEPVKVTIDAPSLVQVIINMMVRYHNLLNSIISNRRIVFTSKLWSLLCYFLDIK